MKNRKIQKRLLNLVLAAGILSFLTLSSLSFYGMNLAVGEMEELGDGVGRAGASFTQNLIEYQQKKTLSDLAKDRADFINSRLNLIRRDVEILSRTMTKIASNPDDYKPIKLLDPRFDEVKNFDPYIIYSPETYLNGMSPETLPESLRREIEIASNIGNILRPMSLSFAEDKSNPLSTSARARDIF